MSLKYGILGDLLLTIFAFIWMFWPLALVYFYELKAIYYLPAGIFSLMFLIKGLILIF